VAMKLAESFCLSCGGVICSHGSAEPSEQKIERDSASFIATWTVVVSPDCYWRLDRDHEFGGYALNRGFARYFSLLVPAPITGTRRNIVVYKNVSLLKNATDEFEECKISYVAVGQLTKFNFKKKWFSRLIKWSFLWVRLISWNEEDRWTTKHNRLPQNLVPNVGESESQCN
jgi:hypothetical protein